MKELLKHNNLILVLSKLNYIRYNFMFNKIHYFAKTNNLNKNKEKQKILSNLGIKYPQKT